ncbi:unnamed protein product [Lactuca virosa]|uniref:F-box domain-containing protein n=1 Tax=Lactuca virosa TaxID=75947 RepID=A0AAU9MNA0_9ASTR|nr:unnamed protein product [Lactuca virosa]
MAKTRSMTRNENDNASNKKRYETSWADINHDVLFFVMMQLRVVDFVEFSGVCKSWRSLALSNRSKFIASRPPISIRIFIDDDESDYCCYLKLGL